MPPENDAGAAAPAATPAAPAAPATGAITIEQARGLLTGPAKKPDDEPARRPAAPAAPAAATADEPIPAVEGADAPAGDEEPIRDAGADGADGDEPPAPADAADRPSVEPPAGWTPDDQAWFKSLPPAKQEVILKREREYRANESRRHAEVERERSQIHTERQHLSAALKTYAQPLLVQFEADFPDLIAGHVDALKIQQTDPDRFDKLQAYEMEFNKLVSAENTIRERTAAESTAAFEEFRAAENVKLGERVPELKDPKALEAFDREVTGYLRKEGISDSLIRNASAVQLSIVRKAMLYDKAMAATPAARPVPRTLTPGAQPLKGERATEARRAALTKLDRTGSIEDARGLLRL